MRKRGEKAARVLAREPRLVRQHHGLDRVGCVEVGDLRIARQLGRRDVEAGARGVQHLHGEQAVERVGLLCGALVGRAGAGGVLTCFCDAAQPVGGLRAAQGAIGGLGQILEMTLGRVVVFQMAEGEPARHEGLLLERIDAQGAGVLRQFVGKLVLLLLQERVGDLTALGPPLVDLGDFFSIRRIGQDELGGLFRLVGFAQQLDAMVGKARVLGIGGQRGHQGFRVVGFVEHGKARLRLHLFIGRQQGHDAGGEGGAVLAVAGPADVIGHEAVEAPLVIGCAEQIAEAVEESGLERAGHLIVAPSLRGVLARFLLVAFRQIGRGERGIADAGLRRGILEEGLDRRRAAALREERFFHALGEHRAVGPQRIVVEEGAILGGLAVAVAQAHPVEQLDADGIGHLGFQFQKAHHVRLAGSRHGLLDALGILRAWHIAARGGKDRVEFGDVLSFDSGALRGRAFPGDCGHGGVCVRSRAPHRTPMRPQAAPQTRGQIASGRQPDGGGRRRGRGLRLAAGGSCA